MAFFKKCSKQPHLSPSDIIRLKEVENGGKFAEFRQAHMSFTFAKPKCAPITMTAYGKSNEDLQTSAKSTLKYFNTHDKGWKIIEIVDLKAKTNSDTTEEIID